MKVAVVGIGHVGLITGAALASLGHEVVGMDTDPAKVETLQAGRLPSTSRDWTICCETASDRAACVSPG